MMPMLADLGVSLLRCLPPETAHRATLRMLANGLGPRQRQPDSPRLGITLWGRAFPNPLGLAAGFDKNAEVPDAMLAMGLGFTEIGTVTPKRQTGNPLPRLFRLTEDRALINRLGFNNEGLAAAVKRLEARHGKGGIVGGNVGRNRETPDEIEDYAQCVRAMAPLVDYLVVNISSPNTPGLRELQRKSAVVRLAERLLEERAQAVPRNPPPLLLKIAPDLSRQEREDLAAGALSSGIDGLIVSNTTVARPPLRSPHGHEPGGLSGAPLFAPSTLLIADMHGLTGGKLPIIGVGGVASGEDAYTKIRAGASLVQLYTALVYQGPGLIRRIKRELDVALVRDGFPSLAAAVGTAKHEIIAEYSS